MLAGEDRQIFSSLCLGDAGAIAVSANIHLEWFVRLDQLVAAGKLAVARRIFHRPLPLMRLLFAEPKPAPVKFLLAQQKWIREELRQPMQAASSQRHSTCSLLGRSWEVAELVEL